jgi:hypothetical protein
MCYWLIFSLETPRPARTHARAMHSSFTKCTAPPKRPVTTLVGGTGRIEATPDASIENVECHTCPVFSVNIPVALARVDDSSPDSRQPYIEP